MAFEIRRTLGFLGRGIALAAAILGTSQIARAQTPAGADSVGTAPADTIVAHRSNARALGSTPRWFVEASVGLVQPGPTGAGFGSGEHFSLQCGAQTNPWSDVALSIAWVHSGQSEFAIDSDITSGVVRGRAFARSGRFLAYGEAGAGLYRFALKQESTLYNLEDNALRVGGLVGAGVQYARSLWWIGLGAQVHGALGSSSLERGSLTFATYDFTVGTPIRRSKAPSAQP